MAAIQRATSFLEKNVLKRTYFLGRVIVSSSLYKFEFFTVRSGFLSFF